MTKEQALVADLQRQIEHLKPLARSEKRALAASIKPNHWAGSDAKLQELEKAYSDAVLRAEGAQLSQIVATHLDALKRQAECSRELEAANREIEAYTPELRALYAKVAAAYMWDRPHQYPLEHRHPMTGAMLPPTGMTIAPEPWAKVLEIKVAYEKRASIGSQLDVLANSIREMTMKHPELVAVRL
jgi:hypothetical protein